MTTITIDFVEHKREQIEAIMVKRDTSEKKLTKCIKTLEKTEFAPEDGTPYQKLKRDIAALEIEIIELTSEGKAHIVKIDKFHGVQ
jgi:hypothetical protein